MTEQRTFRSLGTRLLPADEPIDPEWILATVLDAAPHDAPYLRHNMNLWLSHLFKSRASEDFQDSIRIQFGDVPSPCVAGVQDSSDSQVLVKVDIESSPLQEDMKRWESDYRLRAGLSGYPQATNTPISPDGMIYAMTTVSPSPSAAPSPNTPRALLDRPRPERDLEEIASHSNIGIDHDISSIHEGEEVYILPSMISIIKPNTYPLPQILSQGISTLISHFEIFGTRFALLIRGYTACILYAISQNLIAIKTATAPSSIRSHDAADTIQAHPHITKPSRRRYTPEESLDTNSELPLSLGTHSHANRDTFADIWGMCNRAIEDFIDLPIGQPFRAISAPTSLRSSEVKAELEEEVEAEAEVGAQADQEDISVCDSGPKFHAGDGKGEGESGKNRFTSSDFPSLHLFKEYNSNLSEWDDLYEEKQVYEEEVRPLAQCAVLRTRAVQLIELISGEFDRLIEGDTTVLE
ncbi:uncharacterized protein I303_102736 [Kwoniella dejecticola CBS 10117]|uniref:Uncharacterized protein n=1 Tax=Kwoniella dejecticola CBS 10117 TaxID=1296121 RepID=A0A1A6A9J7_9TREE|nr:uncharacterized protein I303_02751 [Kwoniella dejecticola CBS 10117]OBR86737.1 hypothetical protein I303_02751 [Kwoniella dejecticola CBS 10117]